MSKDSVGSDNKRAVLYLTGAAIGVAVTFFFMLLSAGVILLFNLDRAYSVPLATVSLAAGSFAAAYYVSMKIQSRGYLIGITVGFISFALVTVISLFVNKSGLTLNTLFHLIIILISSAIGGILGVNKNKTKKYI